MGDVNPTVAHVRLVQPSAIPSLKGLFLKNKLMYFLGLCKSQLFFEPRVDLFESLGLSTHESVMTVYEDGCMYVPVQNCEGPRVRLEVGMDIGLIRMIGESVDEFDDMVCEDECNVGVHWDRCGGESMDGPGVVV